MLRLVQVAVGRVSLDFSPHALKPTDQSSSSIHQHGTEHEPDTAPHLSEDGLEEVQRGVFQQHILLAIELGLTVIVHSWSAGHHAARVHTQPGFALTCLTV
jgi:TatD DNase family protein